MVAVVAVIIDHLFGGPIGGFVGVDVFFVISGFLITGLLLREHQRTGHISFLGFYKRRVKRIIPAAMVVILATVVAAWFMFSKIRFDQTLADGVWATFFAANWRFASLGTDYFAADSAVSPLRHYWSLAVEEQFYFVWPWLMLLIFWIVARSRGTRAHAQGVILTVMTVVTVTSFIWAVFQSIEAPTLAYFSTLTRAWELGVGAILAIIAGVFTGLPTTIRPVLAWVGIAGIVASVIFITSNTSGFPAPWAALPVLSTALVIISGSGTASRFIWPLTNPVACYIGDISYSLYLWHWPIIVFFAALFPDGGLSYYLVVLSLTLLFSVLSYHLIEDPIRKSRLFEKRDGRKHQRRPSRKLPTIDKRAKYAAVTTLAIVVVTLTVAALQSQPSVSRPAIAAPVPSLDVSASSPPKTGLLSDRATAITAALRASAWPESTDPSLDLSTQDAYVPEWKDDHCLNVNESNVNDCVYGNPDAGETVALIGDSTAISIMPLLREVYGDKRIQSLTLGECPAATVDARRFNGDVHTTCADHRAWAEDWITKKNPAIVVMVDVASTPGRIASTDNPAEQLNLYTDGLSATLSKIAPASGQVIVMSSPPALQNLQDCKTPTSSPSKCIATVPDDYMTLMTKTDSLVKSGGWGNVKYVPVIDWFCVSRRCPAFVGDIRSVAGGSHLTAAAAQSLAPLFRDVVQ